MTSIFLTGASGYIGGQALHEITKSHPQHAITAIVRNSDAAKRISEAYPNVRTVVGDFDDVDLIEKEASQADIVLHLGSNKHMPSVEAIHRGLQKRQSTDPAFWVQVSGASGLAVEEISSPEFTPGSASSTVFDDLSEISTITSLVRAHKSRAVDNYLLDLAANTTSIKTALVWPPIIYGQGQGPINQRSVQIPTLARVALERGHAVKVGEGANRWGNVHIRDLGRLITKLVEATGGNHQDDELWGENGIYLTGIGEITFAEISERISRAALDQKLIASDEIESLQKAEVDKILGGFVFYGTNARSKARRAVELLKWKPIEESLQDEIPKAVADEAKRRA